MAFYRCFSLFYMYNIVMERKYLSILEEWLQSPYRKPMIIWGARQVGKTYLVNDIFAAKHFPGRLVKYDCSADQDFVSFVNDNPKLDSIINYIEIDKECQLDKDHLLFFDEVQECLPLIQMVKQFKEQRPDIPLILTGSLVRIRLKRDYGEGNRKSNDKHFLFPVGQYNQFCLPPLTFDEFLVNRAPASHQYIKEHYQSKQPIEVGLHEKFLSLFHEYLFIGGMPEVDRLYLENIADRPKALALAIQTIDEIYDNYLGDMSLYQVSRESVVRSQKIFNSIFKQLNKENKNFSFTAVETGKKYRDFSNPIAWLELARIVLRCELVKEKVVPPLLADQDSVFRLYLADMGLFTRESGLKASTYFENPANAFSGIYYENYVAIELAARGINLFYWKGKRDAEFEFLVESAEGIIPIDVKRGRASLNSLEEYRHHNKNKLALKISANQYGFDEAKGLLTIPFYYFPFFLDDLQAQKSPK